jgi:hypothetical protein
MSAIEDCRTAALGGHVARCENAGCGFTSIAYNSCRNRHCPKCQGVLARDWMAAREADLEQVNGCRAALKRLRKQVACPMRHLCRAVHFQNVANAIEPCDHATPLQRNAGMAGDRQFQIDNNRPRVPQFPPRCRQNLC